MDTSSDVRESVSLGECVCNADLCGRYIAGRYELRACDIAEVLEAVAVGDRAKAREVFRSRRVR